MRTKFKIIKTAIMLAVIGLASVVGFSARAQVTPGESGTLTNIPNVFTSTNTVTATTNKIDLRENTGLALQERFSTSAAANIPSGLWLWYSVDGTNHSATPDAILIGTPNGATTVTLKTNWSAAQLSGYQAIFMQLTNGAPGNLTNSTYWHRWNSP